MILYNFRHRGPHEYDKFILNVMQLHNEVALLEERLEREDINQLATVVTDFNTTLEALTGSDSFTAEMLLLSYQFE